MYYVFRKSDGAILSASPSTPIVAEDDSVGIISDDLALPQAKWVDYYVRKRKLKKRPSDRTARRAKVRVEARTKAALDVKRRFYELVEKEEPTPAELQEALLIIGRMVFPKR